MEVKLLSKDQDRFFNSIPIELLVLMEVQLIINNGKIVGVVTSKY